MGAGRLSRKHAEKLSVAVDHRLNLDAVVRLPIIIRSFARPSWMNWIIPGIQDTRRCGKAVSTVALTGVAVLLATCLNGIE